MRKTTAMKMESRFALPAVFCILLAAMLLAFSLHVHAEDTEPQTDTVEVSATAAHDFAEDTFLAVTTIEGFDYDFQLEAYDPNGGDGICIWWNYGTDGAGDLKLVTTAKGYQILSGYYGTAMAIVDGEFVLTESDTADETQLWLYQSVEDAENLGLLVNVATGESLALDGDADSGTMLVPTEADSENVLLWNLQNVTKGIDLLPAALHDFENTYFLITASNGAFLEEYDGVCVWQTSDSSRNSWQLKQAGDDTFRIVSVDSDYYGTVLAPLEDAAEGVQVAPVTEEDTDDELWTLQQMGDTVQIVHKNSGLVLGTEDANPENGAYLYLKVADEEDAGQLWTITNKSDEQPLYAWEVLMVAEETVLEGVPTIEKVRVITEENYLEIYWDREVQNSVDPTNYVLKNGDTELTLLEGETYDIYLEGYAFSSIAFEGEIDDTQPITLEIIEDNTIQDKSGNLAETAVYDVSYENYYTQFYTSESGIVVKASDDVAASSLVAAAEQIDAMLCNEAMDANGIREQLVEYGATLALYGVHENAYFVPEHRSAYSSASYYVEGYGGSTYNNGVSSIAEKNVIRDLTNEDENARTKYENENILVHEFGHAVKLVGMDLLEDSSLALEFQELYNSRKREGRWPNTYAISNSDEFFATMCAIWFNVMSEAADFTDGTRCPVNTRAELLEYDPETYAFFAKIFGEDAQIPAPWDTDVPDDYYYGAFVPAEETEAIEQDFDTDVYIAVTTAVSGAFQLEAYDPNGGDGVCIWWNYGWTYGSSDAECSANLHLTLTENGYHIVTAYGTALAIKDGSFVQTSDVDSTDEDQLWQFLAVDTSDYLGILVNVGTGQSLALADTADSGTMLVPADADDESVLLWNIQNMTKEGDLLPSS